MLEGFLAHSETNSASHKQHRYIDHEADLKFWLALVVLRLENVLFNRPRIHLRQVPEYSNRSVYARTHKQSQNNYFLHARERAVFEIEMHSRDVYLEGESIHVDWEC